MLYRAVQKDSIRAYEGGKERLPPRSRTRTKTNAQLSGQLTLWNQQVSHVRRGTLLVIPTGRALLYAEPIYLQAERSPMPQLRLVVLALQEQLAYGPTLEDALRSLFGNAASTLPGPLPAASGIAAAAAPAQGRTAPASPAGASDLDGLISEAARNLADYQ